MKTPEQIRELIAAIPVNDLNLKHIATTGKINGSLHAELYDRFYKYESRSAELLNLLRELLMRSNFALPENEQDLEWFEDPSPENRHDLIMQIYQVLDIGNLEIPEPPTQ